MEGATGAVEFLSVECDMIFEPECDLETECHEDDHQEGGEGNKVSHPLCRPPSPRLPQPHTPPHIDDLFRGRNVGVYRRSDPNDPFILIFDPTLQPPTGEDKDKCSGRGEGEGEGECSSPEENGEEGWDNGEGGSEGQCRRPVRCSVCHKQFRSQGCLVTHGLTHLLPCSGPPPPCPVCGAGLPSRVALKIHVRRHFSGRTYQCPTCHQCHLSHTQLMMHQQLHSTYKHHHHHHHNTVSTSSPHSQTLTPMQQQAQEGVQSPSECQSKVPPHQEKSHSPLPDLRCERCDATFPTRSALHSHRRSHRERHRRRRRRRHECPECGSQFWRSSALKKHRKAEHDM